MLLLTQSKPAPAILAAAIEEQLARVRAAFSAASHKARSRPVHDLRVAVRHLTAALELAEALGHSVRPASRRVLRELLAALSPLRDAQVQVRAVAGARLDDASHFALKLLRRRARSLKRDTRRTLRALRLGKLRKDIARVSQALLRDTPGAEVVEHALLGELARRHLELAHRRQQLDGGDARALHRGRLALKHYRYVLEVLAPLLPPASEELRFASSELQAQLGEAHDRHVLAERVRDLSRAASRKLAPSLKSWANELEQQSAAAQLAGAAALCRANLQFPA